MRKNGQFPFINRVRGVNRYGFSKQKQNGTNGKPIQYGEQIERIVGIVESARERAFRKVNEELVLMYWDIGEYISKLSQDAEYGDAFVQRLADFFAENYPDLKGFTRRGLYRMKQFHELYKDNEKVSPLVTQLGWSNHLKIMSACESAFFAEWSFQVFLPLGLRGRIRRWPG